MWQASPTDFQKLLEDFSENFAGTIEIKTRWRRKTLTGTYYFLVVLEIENRISSRKEKGSSVRQVKKEAFKNLWRGLDEHPYFFLKLKYLKFHKQSGVIGKSEANTVLIE